MPVEILSTALTADYTASSFDFSANADKTPQQTLDDLNQYLGGIAISSLLRWLAVLLASAACFRAIAQAYLGDEPDWRASLSYGLHRAGAAAAADAALRARAWSSGRSCSSRPASGSTSRGRSRYRCCSSRGCAGAAALGRSFGLVKGRWWRTFGVLAVGFILAGDRVGDRAGRVPHRDRRPARQRRARADPQRAVGDRRPRDRHAVSGRAADRRLLRPARAQGGLRPRAARAGDRRHGPAARRTGRRPRRCCRPPRRSTVRARRTGRRRRVGSRRRSASSGRPRMAAGRAGHRRRESVPRASRGAPVATTRSGAARGRRQRRGPVPEPAGVDASGFGGRAGDDDAPPRLPGVPHG